MDVSSKKARFGRVLREARLRSEVSGRELARRSGIHQSYISKFESGVLEPSQKHLNAIVDALGISSVERNRILSWQKLLDHDFSPFVSRSQVAEGQFIVKQIEANATLIKAYQLSIIPGLLQTPEYMEAIFATESYSDRHVTKGDIKKAISGRIERQEALLNSEKRFHFLLHEGALQNRIATLKVMKKQYESISTLISSGNVSIGIIPFSNEWRGEIALSSFHVYDEELVLIELFGGVLYLYLEETVRAYYRFFEKMQINAIYGQKAINFLATL